MVRAGLGFSGSLTEGNEARIRVQFHLEGTFEKILRSEYNNGYHGVSDLGWFGMRSEGGFAPRI